MASWSAGQAVTSDAGARRALVVSTLTVVIGTLAPVEPAFAVEDLDRAHAAAPNCTSTEPKSLNVTATLCPGFA